MARCVDADKVIDVMKAAYWDENMHSAKDDPCVIDAMIDWSIRQVKDAPTEDVAPVIHAHWCATDAYPHNVYCSRCLIIFAQTHWPVWEDKSLPRTYCPSCGAKMDEKVVEE